MNFSFIDILCVAFLLICAIFGYRKGFIVQLYDIISFLLVLFLVYLLSEPLASIWTIYSYDQSDFIASMIGHMINRLLVGFILFIVLMIIKKVIGFFVKPALKGIMHSLALTSLLDRLLGLISHVLEGIITLYLVLIFLVVPFYPQGRTMIEQSFLAQKIVDMVPSVSQTVLDMTDLLQENQNMETYSQDILARLTLQALTFDIIDEQEALKIFEKHIFQSNGQSIELNASQFEQLKNLLENAHYSPQQIQDFLSQIRM